MAEITINKHNNILIIGEAATNYNLKEINYEFDYEEVLNKYGKSDLTDAFKVTKDVGVKDIFLLNIRKKSDYLDIIELIKQNDFAYIVFTNLYLSDTFRDFYDSNLVHSYFAYILGSIDRHNESVFFVTDKHASLFENIDSYIEFMNESMLRFKNRCSIRANLENIVVTCNNLRNYPYANVILAAVLAATPLPEYPIYNFGEAIFHIDRFDNILDYAYFANHKVRETTVNNLLNCKPNGPEKIVTISRIAKYIKRGVDFSEFKGKLYRDNFKLQIKEKLRTYLDTFMMKNIIKGYKIVSVEAYKGAPGTIDVICNMEIVHYSSFEVCTLDLGVTV